MTEDRRAGLRRKYLSLGTGELVAAAAFAVVAIAFVTPRLPAAEDARALWSALVPLLVILAQAGCYWLLARRWVEVAPMPVGLARAYLVLRLVDVVLLVAGLVGVLVWLPDHVGAALGILAIWLFGVIEYVNYFVVRLAYPIGRWAAEIGRWRKPRLMIDVASAR